MKIAHSFSPIEKSIFLAGPTPRNSQVVSWRPKALEILQGLGFQGTVYVPEHPCWEAEGTYDKQVGWEWEALNAATVIAFWVPRVLSTMPALTTNVEFGMFANSGKIILGSPIWAVKNRYLEVVADRYNIPKLDTLEATMAAAINKTITIYP